MQSAKHEGILQAFEGCSLSRDFGHYYAYCKLKQPKHGDEIIRLIEEYKIFRNEEKSEKQLKSVYVIKQKFKLASQNFNQTVLPNLEELRF